MKFEINISDEVIVFTPLAFAFTSFILNCDEDGSIYYEGEFDKMYLTAVPNTVATIPPSFDLLESEFGLLEIE